MQLKIKILCLFFMVAGVSCFAREKAAHKAIDAFIPQGWWSKPLHAVVHKIAKLQYGCPVVDNWCEYHCQDLETHPGFCHGTKCKCNIPSSY